MELFGTVLPLAIVVGLSPLPIVPAVLLTMTPRARANGLAYLGAWLACLSVLVAGTLLVGGASDPQDPGEESIAWIQVVTGVAFLVVAVVKWVRRPRAGEPAKQPAWMAALDGYGPAQAARLGGVLAVGNPKNLLMALAAGAEIALLVDGPGRAATAGAMFVVIGSLGVGVPIVGYLLLGDRAAPGLASLRDWLERNGTALAIGVLLVLAVMLLLRGLPGV